MKRAACALVALWVLAGAPAAAQGLLDEDGLRAAFVLRFAQFTTWPTPPPGGTLWLCVAGVKSGLAPLEALAQRNVGGATVRVRTVSQVSQVREAGSQCHVLVLGYTDAATLRRWTAGLGDLPVLVVGTSPEAMRGDVAIALISEPQGMAFSVNHGEAQRRGLSLAAPVLKLAREVR